MKWRQISLWAPIPSLRIPWRFSLRFMLLFVTLVAFSLLFYRPPRAATSVLNFPTAPVGATNTQAQIHAQTQAALLQSPFVIHAAMRRNDVRELEVLRRQENPVKWIESQLDVAIPTHSGGGTAASSPPGRSGQW